MNATLLFLLTMGGGGVLAISSLVGGVMYKTYKDELDTCIRKAEIVQASPVSKFNVVESVSSHSLKAPVDSGYTLITGSMGGGKTTALCAISLIRYLRKHHIVVFTSHIKYDTWQIADELYGKGKTSEQRAIDLQEGVKQYLKLIERRYSDLETLPKSKINHEPITIVFDEYGDYTELLGKDLCTKLAHVVGSATRKVNVYIMIATQTATKEFLGNVSGVHALMVQKSVHLNLSSKPDPQAVGGLSPTGSGTLTLMGSDVSEIQTEPLISVLPDPYNPEDFNWLIDVEKKLGVRHDDVKQLVS